MYRDLLFYYQVDLADVFAGKYKPSFILMLVQSLPEGSVTAAMHRDPEHWQYFVGVTQHHYQLAAIYDATNTNTRATGNWEKGKAPKFEPYPTPDSLLKKELEREERRAGGVAGLFRRMTAIHGEGRQ